MILLISSVFPPEPVVSANISFELAGTLSKITKVTVITPKPTRPLGFVFDKPWKTNNNFSHIILNSYTYPKSKIIGRMIESYSFGKHASDYIKCNHIKIKCIYIKAWPLLAQYLITKTAKKYSIPTVIHIQDIYPESLSHRIPLFENLIQKLLLPIDIYVLKNVSKVVTISKNMHDILTKTRKINTKKLYIIENWQDENKFIDFQEDSIVNYKNTNLNNAFTFMYLGNIGPVAGVEFLIEAFVVANIINSQLIIAGSGSQKNECISLSKQHKNAKIEFMDVPSGNVPEVQSKADVMILPVRKNAAMSSIPSKLSAYMFSKKPIIACVDKKSDTAIAIDKANCGWVIEPEDISSLAYTMKIASSLSRSKLFNMGQSGFAYAMEKYSKRNNLRKLENLVIETAGLVNNKK